MTTLRRGKVIPNKWIDSNGKEFKNTDAEALFFYDERDPLESSYYMFTNFADYPIIMDGVVWPTAEHFFQAQKFPHDPARQKKIASLPTAREAFNEGQRRDPYSPIRSDWEDVKDDIMEFIVNQKIKQHPPIQTALLQLAKQGKTCFVENSGENDAYWGNGKDGKGANKLGNIFTRAAKRLLLEDAAKHRQAETESKFEAKASPSRTSVTTPTPPLVTAGTVTTTPPPSVATTTPPITSMQSSTMTGTPRSSPTAPSLLAKQGLYATPLATPCDNVPQSITHASNAIGNFIVQAMMSEMKLPPLSRVLRAPIVRKGNLEGTLKFAFDNAEDAEICKSLLPGRVTYYGSHEKYPLEHNGIRLDHIVRSEDLQGNIPFALFQFFSSRCGGDDQTAQLFNDLGFSVERSLTARPR